MRHIPQLVGRIPFLCGAFRVFLTAYVKTFKNRYMIEDRNLLQGLGQLAA